jgi:hypothetical protein
MFLFNRLQRKESMMYCPNCQCEYVGWTGSCPECKTALIEHKPEDLEKGGQTISYEDLLALVKEHDGNLEIQCSTVSIEKDRTWTFPYFGFGYAWSTRMVGSSDDLTVELTTTEVGKSKRRGFPYDGFGFAWEKRMLGKIGGNELALQASKVNREKKWRFPFLGYGRGWTEEMSGECGDQLKAHFMTTDVGRSREWRFPYRGYGFAWVKRGVLSLSLKE